MEPNPEPRDRPEPDDDRGSQGKLQQMNVGPDNMEGSGEWPSPHEPPRGPAPGTDPVQRELIARQRPDRLPDVADADPVERGSRTLPDADEPDRRPQP